MARSQNSVWLAVPGLQATFTTKSANRRHRRAYSITSSYAPARLRFSRALPKNNYGKVVKTELCKLYGQAGSK